MKQPIFFCDEWNSIKKQAWNGAFYTEDQARAMFAQGKIFTAMMGSAERPSCVIQHGLNDQGKWFFHVDFLDELLRLYLSYGFQELPSESLFLSSAGTFTYDGDTDHIAQGETTIFKEDGLCHHSRTVCSSPRPADRTIDKWDTRTTPEELAKTNYSPKPVFGEYDEIIRIERDVPLIV
jgi:hypothetical protein